MKSITFKQFRDRFVFTEEIPNPFQENRPTTTHKANDQSLHREVAVKIIGNDIESQAFPSLDEMPKLFNLEHGHLVHYFDFLRVEKRETNSGFTILVMDFISNGNLFQLEGANIGEINQGRVVKGILSGLEVLHQNEILHGNLKPGNILIQDIGHLHVRLSDYGFVETRQYETIGSQFKVDSIQYLAPEQIEPEIFAAKGKLQANVDFWALGMLVYELFTGKYVFGEFSGNPSNLVTKILHADLPDDIAQLPGVYADLVRACLIRDAAKRPKSASDLWQILDGGTVWSKGKVRKKPKEKRSTPAPVVLPDIACNSCNNKSKAGTIICPRCKAPLHGPSFLQGFRRPGARGFWAIFFMTILFVPLGYLYFDFYEQCDWLNSRCDLKAFLQSHKDDLKNEEIQAISTFMLANLTLGVVLASTFFLLWIARINSNLAALGSQEKQYHWIVALVSLFLVPIGAGLILSSNLLGILFMLFGLTFPLLTFQEIWKGSNPEFLIQGTKWRRSPRSFLIFSWWLTSLALPVLIALPFLPTSFEGYVYESWFFLGVGLVAVYWLLSILLVIRINRRQMAKFRALARQGLG